MTVSKVKIFATAYDSEGTPLLVARHNLYDETLETGDSAFFDIDVNYYDLLHNPIEKYELTAYRYS
jgi:hypothetical protein